MLNLVVHIVTTELLTVKIFVFLVCVQTLSQKREFSWNCCTANVYIFVKKKKERLFLTAFMEKKIVYW